MKRNYIYGPVPSRRLGSSLGVDIVPYKTCPYDCIYCQIGKTTEKSVERKEYVREDLILSQIADTINLGGRIDYITFSGSGEPTLNIRIGKLIREVKKLSRIKVAVITNSSLFTLKEVRKDLLEADLVVPSLDAATPLTFEKVKRPHPSVEFDKMIEGLINFREEFKGKFWLEVMLIKGVNDATREIGLFLSILSKINPDKIQLNTVVRPPTEKDCLPLDEKGLQRVKSSFGKNCEIICGGRIKTGMPTPIDIENQILELVERRPCTSLDISTSLEIEVDEVQRRLSLLQEKGKIDYVEYGDKRYYRKDKSETLNPTPYLIRG